jgi:hypothetical protein
VQVPARDAGAAGLRGENVPPLSDGPLISFEAGAGRSDNVLLTPSNAVSDVFSTAGAGAEWSRTKGMVFLYAAAEAEARRYAEREEANEFGLQADAEAAIGPSRLAFVVSDTFCWEDYQVFDARGDPLPEGDSRSVFDEVHAGALSRVASGLELRAGGLYARKDFVALPLGFREVGPAWAAAAHVGENVTLSVAGSWRLRTYEALRAAAADGTVTDENPLSSERVFDVEMDAQRDLPRGGRAGLTVGAVQSRENYEGEASYREFSGRLHAAVAAGTRIAVTAEAEAGRRQYSRRVVPNSDARQRDGWTDGGLMIEFGVGRTVSLFGAISQDRRLSNNETLGYGVQTLTAGVRGML